MYRLEYNKDTTAGTQRLYLFKVTDTAGDGYFNVVDLDEKWTWKELEGDRVAVLLRYDPVKENGIFTPIIKSSLEVTLIRENATDFFDIIEAEENEYYAVITEGCELKFVTGTNQIYIDGTNPKILFKGTLTNETYGEDYLPIPVVKLVFHDKIGELADLIFEPTTPQMRLTDIFAELLQTLPASHQLFLEFPFDIQLNTWRNLESPYNLILDVSAYNGAKKLDVLTDILEAFGMQMFVDYDEYLVAYETYPHLLTAGAIRIRLVDTFTELSNDFFVFTLTEESS